MMYKEYEVTITPKITTYAGSSTFGEYTVTVTAKSHAEAPGIDRFQSDRDVHQRKSEPSGHVGAGSPEGNRNHHRVLCRQGLGSDFHRIAD